MQKLDRNKKYDKERLYIFLISIIVILLAIIIFSILKLKKIEKQDVLKGNNENQGIEDKFEEEKLR
jgi:hypothetical protein